MTDTPTYPYWHLYLDDDGVSHQKQCFLTEFELKSIGGGASAQWQGQKTSARSTVMFTVLPVGWIGDWHPNPKPQWIVPLSGRWSVEAMDGTRIEFGPGDISFGDDVGAGRRGDKTGHYSTTVGDAPAVLMLVQFEEPLATPSGACRFQ